LIARKLARLCEVGMFFCTLVPIPQARASSHSTPCASATPRARRALQHVRHWRLPQLRWAAEDALSPIPHGDFPGGDSRRWCLRGAWDLPEHEEHVRRGADELLRRLTLSSNLLPPARACASFGARPLGASTVSTRTHACTHFSFIHSLSTTLDPCFMLGPLHGHLFGDAGAAAREYFPESPRRQEHVA